MNFLPPRLTTLAFCLSLLTRAAAQTVEFSAASYEVNEREDHLVVRVVTDTPGFEGGVRVNVAGGTAKLGEDFLWSTSDWLDFPSGNLWVGLRIFEDGLPEGDETVILELVDPSPGVRIGAVNRTVVTIHNNSKPSVEIGYYCCTSSYGTEPLREPFGSATHSVPLLRRGDANFPFTVGFYDSRESTATLGTDFRLPSPVHFAAGEREKTVELTLLEDAECEGDETVILEMRSPDLGGRQLGTFQIEIEENVIPTTVDFSIRPELLRGRDDNHGPWPHLNGTLLVSDHWHDDTCDGPALRRLLPDGSKDASFHPAFGGCLMFQPILVRPDGRILVVIPDVDDPRGEEGSTLLRLMPDGQLDPSFKAQRIGRWAYLFELTPNGNLIVIGDGALRLLSEDGTPRSDHEPVYLDGIGAGRSCFSRVSPGVVGVSCSNIVRDFGYAAVRLENAPRSGFRPFGPCTDCYYGPLQGGWQAVAQVGDEFVELDIRRLGELTGPASVRYATRDGTAKAGTHYAALAGRLDFAPCERVKRISIPLLDPPEVARQFTLELSDAQGAVVLGPPFPILIRGRQSSFVAEAFAVGPDGRCLLTFDLQPGEEPGGVFTVEVSTDLMNWEVFEGGGVNMSSSLVGQIDFRSGADTQRFYRVRRK